MSSTVEFTPGWGPALEVASEELQRMVAELEADLLALLEDFDRGPVEAMRAQARGYLGELRREFLKVHRRLLVQARSADTIEEVHGNLRREQAELFGRFRTVVLTQSSRIQHQAWTPEALAEAIRQAVRLLPGLVVAPYEPISFAAHPRDGLNRRFRRWALRIDQGLRRVFRARPLERLVEARELARYHLDGHLAQKLEGLASLFFQAQVQLAGRSRQVIEAVAQGVEGSMAHLDQDDFPDMISGLRIRLEDELASVEREVSRILDDGVARARALLGEALVAFKEDLPVYATVDLRPRQRRSGPVVAEAGRTIQDLTARLGKLREAVAGDYVLLALHLEYAGFRSRVQQTMDGVLAELRADVRGRSWVQLERVRAALDEVLEGLEDLQAGGTKTDGEVRTLVQPLEQVIEEASGVTRQLLDQLSAETCVSPLLDALNREAHGLTDRYRVPANSVPRAEWKLPAPVPIVEVEFAHVVTGFVQREVAPELLTTTNGAMKRVLPILEVFQDLERVVSFNAEILDDRFDVSAAVPPAGQQLADIMKTTLIRGRDGLAERLDESAHWDEDLGADIRSIVRAKLDELRRRLGEGDISRAKVARVPQPRLQLTTAAHRLSGAMQDLRARTTARLRRAVGAERLTAWREALGLPQSETSVPVDGADWAPLKRSADIPVVYSRLFAGQARWAGDVLNVPDGEVRRAREALASGRPGLKVAALIGADSAGRGALVGAVLRGVKAPRRLMFTQPTSAEHVRASVAEVAPASAVQIGGLGWLLSARPDGFAPLQALIEAVVRDERRTSWLLEADALTWAFAASVSPLADVFATQIRVPDLTPQGLQAAVLARHNLSGYDLRFELGDQVEGLDDELGRLRERYFLALHAASGGLLQVALPLWLASVGRVLDDSMVTVITREPAPPGLSRLPESAWTVLFLTARQGWINAGTLAFALQIAPSSAEGRLHGLAGLGLLERSSREVFQIRRHLRGAVRVGLKHRGWIA